MTDRRLVRERALAFVCEGLLPILLINLLLSGRLPAGAVLAGAAWVIEIVMPLAYLIWLGYFLFKDGLPNGQSLVKRWRGLRVTTLTGQPCTAWQSFVRNAIVIIPAVVYIEAVLVWLRPDGRRLGDLLAKTVVVAAPSPTVAPAPSTGGG